MSISLDHPIARSETGYPNRKEAQAAIAEQVRTTTATYLRDDARDRLTELRAALKPRGVLFSSNPRGSNEEGFR